MRVLVVVNPRATATTERQRDVLAHALADSAELQIEQTGNRGHAAALACRAMRDGVDLVVALGGDGTVNEVVNGLLTDGIHDRVPSLGVVPAGSTNVFARALGLPNDPFEATGAMLDALRAGRSRPVSLARANGRWFIFTAGIGFDAAIVARVERQRARGKAATNLLYARCGVREYASARRNRPLLHIDLPDGSTIDNLHVVIVGNTDPWTFVGNRALHATPHARFDTDLGLYARSRLRFFGTAYAMAQMTRERPRLANRSAISLDDMVRFTVRADEPAPFQVDGDLLGPQERIEFESVRDAIRVVC